MIHRNVEKALDLRRMQVDRQHPVHPRRHQQVRHQLRRNRHPRAVLAVLPRIGEERHHRRDPLGRRPPRRVGHDQQLHQILVRRHPRRLDDEHIPPPHGFLIGHGDFAVRIPFDARRAQRHAHPRRDLLRQRPVRISRENLDVVFHMFVSSVRSVSGAMVARQGLEP
jgi:hypothetical protein